MFFGGSAYFWGVLPSSGHGLRQSRRDQNINFKASWICRDVPSPMVRPRVLNVLLKAPVPKVVLGWSKFARLKILKNSARNSGARFSLSFVFLSTAKSTCLKAGPKTVPRPRLPKVPLAGNEKAAGLNQLSTDLWPGYGLTPMTALGRWLVCISLTKLVQT
jgi:hypothetical protein